MKIDTLRQSVIGAQPNASEGKTFVAPDIADSERSLKDMLKIVRRQLSFILIVLFILSLPIAIYALRLEPQYKSVASVVVEPQSQALLLADGSQAARPPDPAYLETLASVIRSRKFVAQAMTELDLFDDPEFAPSTPTVFERAQSFVEGFLSTYVFPEEEGESLNVPPYALFDEDATLASMAIFDDLLEVKPQSQSYVIKISFTSEDPVKAATIANFMARRFIEVQLEEKSSAVRRAIGGISERLSAAQEAMEQAEEKVADMRLKSNFMPGQTAPVISVQSEELARTLMKAKAEYALVSAKLQTIEAQQAEEASLENLAEITASQVVGQLRLQVLEYQTRLGEALEAYGEEHPRAIAIRSELEAVQANMDEEIGRIVGGIRSDAAIISAQINELEAQLAEARERNLLDSATATQLENAQSNAAVKRSLYEALLRRQEETSVQQSWLMPDVRLISEAGPPLEPNSLSPTTLMASGVTVSLILALLLGFMREQMDGSFRSNRQVESDLGLPCLGLVPKLKRWQQRKNALVSIPPGSSYAQSVSAVWVQLRIAKRSAKVLLVTSALPREGASSLAESLATCAHQLDGLNTALVDFNLWSSRRDGFSEREDGMGVAQYLAQSDVGDVSIEDVVQTDSRTGIDVYPAGRHHRSAIEMAGEKALGKFLSDLRNRYDVVILDGPPILGSGDVSRLANLADATLLAIRWGSTSTDAAGSALHTLLQASAQVVGAVLTQVDARRQRLYGRGDNVQYTRLLRNHYSA